MTNNNGHPAPHWEHFAHEADMGIRGFGPTCAEAFEQAALALSSIVSSLASIRPEHKITFACAAPNVELLLVDWLNAIIFEMSTRHMLFSRYEVQIDHEKLTGAAWGETVTMERHSPAVEPKGATYTNLSVHQKNAGWVAQCVVDV